MVAIVICSERVIKKSDEGIIINLYKTILQLFKWWWRYACEEGVLWRRVIQSLHEEDQGFMLGRKIATYWTWAVEGYKEASN